MFIGFPEQTSAVRENMFPDLPTFPIFFRVHSLRVSEIEYSIVISVTGGTATIFGLGDETGDASFGTRDPQFNILVDVSTLRPGEQEISGIRAVIVDDIASEGNETFTLRISAADVGGVRRNFECYDDGEDPVEGNFFCSHTITIVDDDG